MKSLRSLSSYLLKLIGDNISDELDDIDTTYTDTTPKPAVITDSAPKFQYPEIFIDIDRINTDNTTLRTDYNSLACVYDVNIYVSIMTNDSRVVGWISNYVEAIIKILLGQKDYFFNINRVDITDLSSEKIQYTKIANINIEVKEKE